MSPCGNHIWPRPSDPVSPQRLQPRPGTGCIYRTRDVALLALPCAARVRTPTLLEEFFFFFLWSLFLRARVGAKIPVIEGRLGSARHALGAEPSRLGLSGPGRRPESLGTTLPSLSSRAAWDSEVAFGAISHRGQ